LVKNIQYKMDINTLHRLENEISIEANDIARISIRTTKPLFFDNYSTNRNTGSVIIIDEGTNNTVGAGMII
jgi:sulfate adenylyltransferase subunit 1